MTNLILCEGETDQILIGYYLEKVYGWKYRKQNERDLFPDKNINWLTRDNNCLGIWKNGGDDFSNASEYIFRSELMESSIARIIIVGDNDDSNRENSIIESICNSANRIMECAISFKAPLTWEYLDYSNWSGKRRLEIAYMLLPSANENGALETFILNALSEENTEKELVVEQSKQFIKNFNSDVYLRKRREKIKAELGVSLSIFSPDKIFTTMNELLLSVEWEKYNTINSQFTFFKDL